MSAASLRNRGYPVWEASVCGSSRPLEGDPSGSAWSRGCKGQPDKMCVEPRCGGGQPKRAGQPNARGVICEPWQRGEPVRLSHRPVANPAIAASLQPPGVGTTRQLVRGEPPGERATRCDAVSPSRAAKVGSTRCPSAWRAGEQPDGRGANPQVTANGGEPVVLRSTHPRPATGAEPYPARSTHLKEATRAEPLSARSTHAKGATRAEPFRGRSTHGISATFPEPSPQRPTRAVVAPLAWSQPLEGNPVAASNARGARTSPVYQSLWRQHTEPDGEQVNPASRSTGPGAMSQGATHVAWHGASLAGAGQPARKSHFARGQPMVDQQHRGQSQKRPVTPNQLRKVHPRHRVTRRSPWMSQPSHT
jgi:hypothetical protein